MAFTGKPGTLTFSQILSLLHSSDDEKILKIETDNTIWCIKSINRRIVSIAGDPLEEDMESILIGRGHLKIDTLKAIDDSRVQRDGLARVLLQEEAITEKQAEQATFHLSECAFFEFMGESTGSFEIIDKPCMEMYELHSGFSEFIAGNQSNPELLKQFRTHFPDFDGRLYWITPAQHKSLPGELSLKEIRILSRYRPSITIRSFWETLTEPVDEVSRHFIRLSEMGILNSNPPGSAKIPNAKPFLRALLGRVVDQLLSAHKLLGASGEFIEILQSINENLVKMPDLAAAAVRSEELGDLSGLTGSLDGLLDLNGVEELNLEDGIQSKQSPAADTPAKPIKKPAHSDRAPKKPVAKPGVQRQPVKPVAQKKPVADSGSGGVEGGIERLMKPNPQREAEALAIMEASKKFDRDGVSLEEKVDAKVRYRHFTSEVNMSFNRFTMTKQTLFEVFGLTPNANKKAIHKAFVKTINLINPKGIFFQVFDKDILLKAIFMRDQLKKAYIILMDDQKKRAYVDNMRKGRQQAEANKVKAMQLFNEGMDKVRAGRFDEAREIFRRAAKFDPNSPVYYTVMEDIDKEEREGNAVKFFQAGILAFKQKNDFERAIKLIKKALTLRPLDPTYHLKLAEIQAMSPEHKEAAVDSYLKALDLDPGNQELRLLIANYLKNMGRKQEAANMYQEIVKWNPENTIVQKHLENLEKDGIKPDTEEKQTKEQKKETQVQEEYE